MHQAFKLAAYNRHHAHSEHTKSHRNIQKACCVERPRNVSSETRLLGSQSAFWSNSVVETHRVG